MALKLPTPPQSARGTRRFKMKRAAAAGQQAELLRYVRARAGLSRMDLARALHLAPSTVGLHVDHLVERGFLNEGKPATRDSGRPPTILALNPQGGRFIGVDFEARNIMAVAVDFSQRPLKRFHDAIPATGPVDRIMETIQQAIVEVGVSDGLSLLAIGVGVPGVVDPATGVALGYRHIRGWSNVPLVERLADRFGVPVFLENNIRTMALAELWFGQGRGLANFICVGLRSGLGAGIIIDGQIYRGAGNRAGEIGDWPCPLDKRKPAGGLSAGRVARLEEVLSVEAVGALGAVASSHRQPLEAVVEAAAAGEEAAMALLDRTAESLGLVLNQLNSVFAPEKIILAGAFPLFGDLFLDRLDWALRQFGPASGPPPVVCSELGEFNGATGAAALAVHRWKPTPC